METKNVLKVSKVSIFVLIVQLTLIIYDEYVPKIHS